MPAAVSEYISSGNVERCLKIQRIIIQTYRDDFGKYGSKVKHKYLEKVFFAVPKMVGRKFQYSQVDSDLQSRDLKEAIELREKEGVIHRIRRTSGEGLPLEANARERNNKTAFLDIGLMQNICGLDSALLPSSDEEFLKIGEGAVAEQFTAQELLAYHDYFQDSSLYYWAREARNSNAEVDYIFPCFTSALPVEVKAGSTGTLRSMHIYLEKYRISAGVRISQLFFNDTLPIISLPFYEIKNIARFMKPSLD